VVIADADFTLRLVVENMHPPLITLTGNSRDRRAKIREVGARVIHPSQQGR
jgi:hypothetical protein